MSAVLGSRPPTKWAFLLPPLWTGVALCLGISDPTGERRDRDDAEQARALENEEDRAVERARWNAMLRRDSSGRVLSRNRLKALQDACDMSIDLSMKPAAGEANGGARAFGVETFAGSAWQSLGPRPIASKQTTTRTWGSVSGRVSGVTIHPSDPSTLLLASATGGIWKSTDSGSSWRPVSDSAPGMAVSSVVYAPSNPSIAFAATGEVDNAGGETIPAQSLGTYLGAGVLKSNDGGETWRRVDADLPENAVLSRVVVHPADPQKVLVGVYLYQQVAANSFSSGGVYRSTDGGVHFTRTFFNRISDLVGDPGDSERVYAAAGRCSECPSSGVYASSDFGQTWTPSLTPANPVANFSSPSGRVRLGVTRAAGSTVIYASVLDADNQHAKAGIFRSGDGGATWSKVSTNSSMCPAPPSLSQCSYDHWISPDAGSSSTVYFGSIDIYKSSDGGASWAKIIDNYNTRSVSVPVHPDQHGGTPGGGAGTFYFATDGGLYRTRDGGLSFENLNATLTLSQFNGIALHPTDPEFASGGTQDNGNLFYTGQPQWQDRTSGDGGVNLIRRDNPSHVLAANYYAFLGFSANGGTDFAGATPCDTLMDCNRGEPLEDMSFYIPAIAAPAAPGTVFLGTNRIWSNSTFGADSRRWQARSSGSILATKGDFLTALEVVGDGSGIIWAGSSLGQVLLSTDGGAAFVNRSSGLPGGIVTRIVSVNPEERVAYVTLGGFLGSPSRHVFRTIDAGLTWSNVSSNLPDVPITALAIDPSDPQDLFVGSDVGVFRSIDGGTNWSTFNQGLPSVSVSDLKFHRVSGDLYAATYGRGVFRIKAPALPPVAAFHPAFAPAVAGQPMLFVDSSVNGPTSWSWSFGDPGSGASNSSAEKNPKHAFAATGTYTVTLTVHNAMGTSQVSQVVTVQTTPCLHCRRVVPFH